MSEKSDCAVKVSCIHCLIPMAKTTLSFYELHAMEFDIQINERVVRHLFGP